MGQTEPGPGLSFEDVFRRTADVIEKIGGARPRHKSRTQATGRRDGLGVDSLAKINLIIAFEEEFGLEIDEAAVPASAFESVSALAQFVHQQLHQR